MENNHYLWIAVIVGIVILLVVGYVALYNRLQKLHVKVEEGYAGIDVALEKRYDLLSEQIEAVKKYLNHEYKLFTDITAQRTAIEQEEKRQVQQKALTREAIQTINAEISQYSQNMEQIKGRLEHAARHRERRRRRTMEQEAQKRAVREGELAQTVEKRRGSVEQKVGVLANAHRDLANVGAGIDALSEQYPMMNSWVSMDKFQLSIVNSEEHLQAARRLYNSNVSLYNQTVVAIPWSMVAALCGMEKAEFYEIEDKKRNFSVQFD